MPDLYSAYIEGKQSALEYYARPPRSLFEQTPEAHPWDAQLTASMRTLQAALGLDRSFEGNEAVVITGQQAGLFTGPLYTIYKAITAIRLAEEIEERSGKACVPIFWIGSDDHDFEEVRTVHYLDRRHQHRSLTYTPEYAPSGPLSGAINVSGFPMHHVPLTEPLHGLVDALRDQCPGSEFADEIAAFLHESLASCVSLADWCALLIARLFRDTRLLVFMPHLMAPRLAAAPVIQKAIEAPLEASRLVNAAGARLQEAGFTPLIEKGAEECAFFLKMGSRRRKVVYAQGRFFLPEERMHCTQEDLLALVEAAPEQFSPNVALRCITQQALFPVAAYVAGPGEVAYWAQLRDLFDFFEQPMPVVYPRARALLRTRKLNQLSESFGFAARDYERPRAELIEAALRRQASHPALPLLRAYQERMAHTAAEFVDAVAGLGLDNTMPQEKTHKLQEHIAREFAAFEQALLREDTAQREAIIRRVDRLLTACAPEKKPQERVYSIFSFLFEHGWDLVPKLTAALDIDRFQLNEVEL